MRYQAPEHTTAVFAPSRSYGADHKGVIEVPDDASEADHAAMLRAGCTVAAAATDAAPAPAKSAAPAKTDDGE
jgi:hypothetical protein